MNKIQEHQQDANLVIKTPWIVRISRLINGDATKNSLSKFKASTIAIVLGLILGIIPILIAQGNPILGYWLMISGPFTATAFRRTIAIISVFIILGTGIGVSFRTGLFNIGATGQFLMAGLICTLFGINGSFNDALGKPGSLMVLLLISMIVGALSAALPALLKAFFNVHEVVSTILLNWVIFFIVRWTVTLEGIRSSDGTSTKSLLPNSQFSLSTSSFDYIWIFVLAFLVALLLFGVFKFTNFGFRLKLNGLSPTAANYSGINTKINILYSMMISGALAGLAGFIFYSSIEKVVPKLDTLPTIGFEALTVTLLAFSSPLGCILSGFFYGVIYQGKDFMQVGSGGSVVKETAALTLGIIIFISALAAIFVHFYPWKIISKHYYLIRFKYFKTLKREKHQAKILIKDHYHGLIARARINYESKNSELKVLKDDFIEATNAIYKKYLNRPEAVLEKELDLNELNEKFQAMVKINNLNQLHDLITNKKLELKELRKQYKFTINKAFLAYEFDVQKLRQIKSEELIHLIANPDLNKQARLDKQKQIKSMYQAARLELIKEWKQGVQTADV